MAGFRRETAEPAAVLAENPTERRALSGSSTPSSSSSFFAGLFAPGDEDGADPLVEIVRRDPPAASRFLRSVMVFSGAGGVLVALVSGLFLWFYWNSCGGCDRPLRWWLLVHAILQTVQVPVRAVFLARLRVADAAPDTETGNILSCVSAFTASPAWRASKQISLVTYGWFVLGVVWVLNAGSCANCPSIYRMTIAVILQAVARAAVALVCFRLLLPRAEAPGQIAALQVEAATAEQIAALPLVRFTQSLFDDPDANCAVCLSEYTTGDMLRRLPCKHHFHRRCADKWLARSKRCPLCMGSIDVCTSKHTEHCKSE